MSHGALVSRLRKLEALQRPTGGVFFALWGRDERHLAAERERLARIGALPEADLLVRAVWPFADHPMPEPRWIAVGGMTPIEEDAVIEEMRRRGLFDLADEAPPPSARQAARMARMTDEELTRGILAEGAAAAG